MHRRRGPEVRRPLAFTVVLALTALTTGCRSARPTASPGPSATVPTTALPDTTTSPPTTSRPSTTGVPRSTTTTVVALGPGDAYLSGTVSGPAGPVDGATVHIERIIGKGVATADVTTAGGAWHLDGVLGGPYRLRAFKAPDLVAGPVEAFFLGATDRKIVDFNLANAGGDKITAVIDPNPPRVDQPALLTVQLGIGQVDSQGRASIAPKGGIRLMLIVGPGHVLESAAQTVTDGNGAGAWRIRCVVQGASSVSLMVGTGVTQVNLPPCGPPGATGPAPTSTTLHT